MKTIKLLSAILFAFAIFQYAYAQSDKIQRNIGIETEKIKVSGTGDMDKRLIETAAYAVDGMKSAFRDMYSQTFVIIYNVFKKDVPDIVQKRIAFLGNDTEKYRADDAIYQ